MVLKSGFEYWEALRRSPLTQRLGPAPAHFISYFALVQSLTGIPHRLRAVTVPPDFSDDVRNAIEDLPAVVKERLEQKLLGVFFVNGLGSTGVTDIVSRDDGEVIGALVLLDFDLLSHRTANEWATWKENMPFLPAAGITLEALVAQPPDDNRKNAIQHLLLHEFGHVLSAGEPFVPDWWSDAQSMQAAGAYSFLSLDWQIADDREIIPTRPNEFPWRSLVNFYTGARIDGNEVPAVYAALQETGFPSLYAATNVYDDFAESFAIYVHTVLMKRPFETRIWRGRDLILQADAASRRKRCPEKYRLLDRFLDPAG